LSLLSLALASPGILQEILPVKAKTADTAAGTLSLESEWSCPYKQFLVNFWSVA